MQSSKKGTAKGFSSKSLLIVGALVVLIIVIAWALYAANKPQSNNTEKTAQAVTVVSLDESLRQNGATQVCSAGNTGPGNLTTSSTNIVYQMGKNKTDTEAIINKVATDNGYSALTHTTNGSADFYEGNNADKSATVNFVVYSDRKYTTCDPAPNADPNQTAFILSMTHGK